MSQDPSKIQFDEKLTALSDKVVIRKLEKRHKRSYGGIDVPTESFSGYGASEAIIEDIGFNCPDTGLSVGDIVYFDEYAVYYPTYPTSIVSMENVICLSPSDEKVSELPQPVGEQILLTFAEEEESTPVDTSGIVVPETVTSIGAPEYATVIGLGLLWGESIYNGHIEIGDEVLIERRDITTLNISDTVYFIVNPAQVIAKKPKETK